jgi:glycosyltransferase involved in cell wall biosynthesis
MSSKPKVAVDISQFANDPYASGIQRLVWGIAEFWPTTAEPLFVYSLTRADSLRSIPAGVVAATVNDLFQTSAPKSEWPAMVKSILKANSSRVGSTSQLLKRVDAWLLPEVTYNPQFLRRLDQAQRAGVTFSAIVCDAFPETHPDDYPQGPGYGDVAQYFRRLATADVTIAISEYSDQILHQRLRRNPQLPSYVSLPGGDHVSARHSPAPEQTQFCVVSSLEARKRHIMIIDGLIESGMTEARLVLAGRRSGTSGPILEKVAAAQALGFDVEWVDSPTDYEIQRLYDRSTSVFSCGDEGYGIPVLEAIRQGCPVSYMGIQPAAQICDGMGASRIPGQGSSAIAVAMRELGDRQRAASLRETIDPDALPVWQVFAQGVVDATLQRRRSGKGPRWRISRS